MFLNGLSFVDSSVFGFHWINKHIVGEGAEQMWRDERLPYIHQSLSEHRHSEYQRRADVTWNNTDQFLSTAEAFWFLIYWLNQKLNHTVQSFGHLLSIVFAPQIPSNLNLLSPSACHPGILQQSPPCAFWPSVGTSHGCSGIPRPECFHRERHIFRLRRCVYQSTN